MIVNARITAWSKRTGSDKNGVAIFAAQALPSPVAAAVFDASIAQQELLATRGLSASRQAIYRLDRSGAPDVRPGDRLQLDNLAWWDVVSLGATVKGSLSHRLLMLKEAPA